MKQYILTISIFITLVLLSVLNSEAQGSKSVKEIGSNELSIYPNPSSNGEFKVKGDFIIEIEVLNLIGKSLFHNRFEIPSLDEITVKIEKAERGYYLMKITLRENKTIVKKILLK